MKKLLIVFSFVLVLCLIETSSFAAYPGCGDVYPPESSPGAMDCGDGIVNILDLAEVADFINGYKQPDDCQAPRADVPTGTPPNCIGPDGEIDDLDYQVIYDKVLEIPNCCDAYNIPTLTEWGVIIFMTVILGIGVMVLRKRRMA